MMTSLSLFTENSPEKTSKDLKKGFFKFSSVLDKRSVEFVKKKNITQPYQFFGVWIAQNLGDFTNIALYIRLAKYQEKGLLEQAVSYLKDYPDPKSRHKLFMWYLKGKMKKMPSRVVKKKKKIQSEKLL